MTLSLVLIVALIRDAGSAPEPTWDADECVLIRRALDLSSLRPKAGEQVVIETTTDVRHTRNPKQFLPALADSTVEDFQSRSHHPANLSKLCRPIRFRATFAAHEELEALFKADDGWEQFHRRFAHATGVITVSRPGFSTDRKEAVIYVGGVAGPRSGFGALLWMKRHGRAWFVEKEETVWMT
jgi:hypothetical protein